jgi:hypothetical protein
MPPPEALVSIVKGMEKLGNARTGAEDFFCFRVLKPMVC